ncbi:Flp pilus assembly complex ATPase component TadA [bacterium]|nr:Flp pilus assembly complex ATPase component TadA [bacterium]MBU1937684.1 Flp pilus assembly complex ATPase component TadA [bacterium]
MRKKIGEILLDKGKITEKQLNEALSRQKDTHQKIGEVLVALGYVVEEDVYAGLAQQWDISFVRSDDILIASDEAVRIVPEPFARENRLIPVAIDDGTLKVAMADPDNIVAIDNLHKLSNMFIDASLAAPSAIENAIEQLYVKVRKAGEVTDVIGNLQFFAESDSEEEGLMDMTKVQAGLEDAPVVKLVNLMIADALRERATDIHIEVQEENVAVRFRIDGVLHEAMTPPKSSHPGIISRVKILSKLNIAEKRLPQDGRFTIISPDKEVDVRVSILPTVNGEKIVLRLLDKTGFAFNLSTLGMDDELLKIFRRWIRQPYGMIIISGPTGSGKSTTLYASLKEIKSEEDNIVTVEDPVEYHLEGINQVQTKPKIGLTFANALRSILRQDPDKLLIGEIRDEETADISIKFSLTGHLVFSTVHANDAPSTITRLLDIGVPPFLAGSCLNLIMAQRLVRRICPQCKETYVPSDAELDAMKLTRDDVKGKNFYRGRGCVHCRNTGYYGRTGIFELLEMKQPMRRLVFENANEEELREMAVKLGMISLRDAALNKIYSGITTPHELLRVTVQEY